MGWNTTPTTVSAYRTVFVLLFFPILSSAFRNLSYEMIRDRENGSCSKVPVMTMFENEVLGISTTRKLTRSSVRPKSKVQYYVLP